MPAHRNPSAPTSRYKKGGAVVLPAEHDLPAPDLPGGRRWTKTERARWAELWASPQALMWDESVRGTVALLVAYEYRLLCGDGGTAWIGQEARHAAEALGLTPQALQRLGWSIGE